MVEPGREGRDREARGGGRARTLRPAGGRARPRSSGRSWARAAAVRGSARSRRRAEASGRSAQPPSASAALPPPSRGTRSGSACFAPFLQPRPRARARTALRATSGSASWVRKNGACASGRASPHDPRGAPHGGLARSGAMPAISQFLGREAERARARRVAAGAPARDGRRAGRDREDAARGGGLRARARRGGRCGVRRLRARGARAARGHRRRGGGPARLPVAATRSCWPRRCSRASSCSTTASTCAPPRRRSAASSSRRCRRSRVLATSREPLGVDGETLLVLGPLALPASGDRADVEAAPATRLFAERARSAGARASATAAEFEAIADLCRRLDGVPLAIELAAARARSLTSGELLAHLDRRFDLLRRAEPVGRARHASLRAAIDTSYELLGRRRSAPSSARSASSPDRSAPSSRTRSRRPPAATGSPRSTCSRASSTARS